MDDATQAQFVLDYLDKVREAQRFDSDIDRIYTDPAVDDPDSRVASCKQILLNCEWKWQMKHQ